MKCKQCGEKIIITNPKTRNIKFCSIECRNKYHYKHYLKDWAINKRNELASKPDEAKCQCLICGRWYLQVGSHITQTHKITAREYREEYGFDVKRGQTRGWYKELKSEQAYTCGGLVNLLKGIQFWFHKGQKGIGTYKRSKQTLDRLKHLETL